MFTSRTLTGSTVWEQLNPAFRMVDFSDSPAVITVSHYLRLAWSFVPDASYQCDEVGIGRFMRETQARAQAEAQAQVQLVKPVEDDVAGEEVPLVLEEEGVDESKREQIEEAEKIAPKSEAASATEPTEESPEMNGEETGQYEAEPYTAWQLAILAFWNHVFWDVMQFLPHVGMGIGHFHAPSHTSLTISFPPSSPTTTSTASKAEPALKHTFPTNTLLIPAYLAPGVTLRMTTGSDAPDVSTEEVLGTFSHETKTDCWWLRQGVEVSIYIDSSPSSPSLSADEQGKAKVAAVLAIGILCDTMHEEAVEAIEAEEVQQAILEAEMEIPVDGPVLEVH